ncbi:MAG: hypothetical protein WBF53_02650, partial [Litorimonas sp.]
MRTLLLLPALLASACATASAPPLSAADAQPVVTVETRPNGVLNSAATAEPQSKAARFEAYKQGLS